MGHVDLLISATFSAAVNEAEMRSRVQAAAPGAGTTVRWRALYLSLDGRRALAHVQASDAAAALAAWQRAGLPAMDAAVARVLDAAVDRSANVVVESRDEAAACPGTGASNHGAGIRAERRPTAAGPSTCLINHRVSLVGAAVFLDGRRRLTFYHAPDTESVRLAQRHGSIDAGPVWACRQISLSGLTSP